MRYTRPNAPGVFVTFEGGEGTGKTTQIHLLYRDLKHYKLPVIRTREPGATKIGAKLRRLLLHGNSLTSKGESLLMWTDREDHVTNELQPAMEQGKIVLCDRFSDSSKAYQGYGRGLGNYWSDQLESLTIGSFAPDLTFLFLGNIETLLARVRTRAENDAAKRKESTFDNEAYKFHKRVMDGYKELAKKNPKRFRIIDAEKPIDFIHGQIYGITTEFLRENYKPRQGR